MIGPISRILARYIAGMLVAAGLLDVSFGHEIGADPDFALILQTVIGFVLMSVTEGWYWFARRMGRAT